MYQELADMACTRITAGITNALEDHRPIKALLDPYNPTGSTVHVRFNTSRADRWDTSGPPPKNHVNWVVLDSDWEAEFLPCRRVASEGRGLHEEPQLGPRSAISLRLPASEVSA